jgi:hypothetical protein
MTPGQSFITRFGAGLLIGLCAVGGLFAVATAAAGSLGGRFALEERESHRRSVEFEARAARSTAEYGEQRAQCRALLVAERKACYAEALQERTPILEAHNYRNKSQ